MEYMSRRLLMDDDVYYNGRAEESFFLKNKRTETIERENGFR